jgi:hypothetical protein
MLPFDSARLRVTFAAGLLAAEVAHWQPLGHGMRQEAAQIASQHAPERDAPLPEAALQYALPQASGCR